MADFVKVATVSEIAPGTAKKVEVNGREIALFNANGTFYAVDDMCPHRGGPLSDGDLHNNEVTCPWHGWRFNVATGVSPMVPSAKVTCYSVKVEGSDIYVSA